MLIERLKSLFAGTARHRSSAAAASEHHHFLTENSPDVIFRCGPTGHVRYISPSSQYLLGWTPREILDQGGNVGTNSLIHPDDAERVRAAAADHYAGKFDELKLEFRAMRHDGSCVWVETHGRSVLDPQTGEREIVFSMRDISEKKRREAELAALAMTDGLTELANRRAFDEALDREWSRALSGQGELSLLLLDVDHFKKFNDTNGHQVGDDCLRAIGRVLQRIADRPEMVPARYGGEEFAVIVPGANQAAALDIGLEICAAVRALQIPHPAASRGHVTVSIGAATAVARAGGTIRMPEGLLMAADSALYRAKAAGRDTVHTALLLAPEADLRIAS